MMWFVILVAIYFIGCVIAVLLDPPRTITKKA